MACEGADEDFGVEEAGGADDLFDDVTVGELDFCGAWGGGDVDAGAGEGLEFFVAQGSVVECGGEAEAVFDEGEFAGAVAVIHGGDLGESGVGFVDDDEGVGGEEVEEGVGA